MNQQYEGIIDPENGKPIGDLSYLYKYVIDVYLEKNYEYKSSEERKEAKVMLTARILNIFLKYSPGDMIVVPFTFLPRAAEYGGLEELLEELDELYERAIKGTRVKNRFRIFFHPTNPRGFFTSFLERMLKKYPKGIEQKTSQD